jgi:signal transduction histidine kinase
LAPDEIAGILEKFQACIDGSVDDVLLEHRVRCKNGNWKWVQANGSLVSRTEGSVLAIGTLTDITHIKQMEAELKNRAERLQELVEKETMLRLDHERIVIQRSKHADMGEMIGAIAHQWRQPLSTVSVIFQNLLAARRMNKLDEAYLEKAATDATALIRHMSKTIDSFRNFFKPEKTKEVFNAIDKIEDAVGFILGQLRSNGISVVLPEHTYPEYIINGFPNEFAQVMLNLLANARDAILDTQRTQGDSAAVITITAKRENNQLIIQVTDSGCGIPPDAADRIFEPYFTTKEEGQGTGIGLYMSKQIIEQSMGGTLTFTSKPGETVFRIEVPHA